MELEIINQPRVFPHRTRYQIAKRVMDIGLCLLALPFVLPLMAITSLLVRLDSPGPVIFTQWRTGKGGKRFRMYKFRTMVPDAEKLKAKYAHLNKLPPPDFKITNDPRMTGVGCLLRKTSLDELPQILNVLKGEMSLVGPRPTSFSVDTYSLWHTTRLEVLPGVTGLWQVSGRSDVDFDDRLRLDIAYIEQQGLWLDLTILFKTIGALVTRRGAH